MPAPHLAPPPHPGTDPVATATAYGERFADLAAAEDARLGIPAACTRLARAARVIAGRDQALAHWQGERDAWAAIPVVEFVTASTGVTIPARDQLETWVY